MFPGIRAIFFDLGGTLFSNRQIPLVCMPVLEEVFEIRHPEVVPVRYLARGLGAASSPAAPAVSMRAHRGESPASSGGTRLSPPLTTSAPANSPVPGRRSRRASESGGTWRPR